MDLSVATTNFASTQLGVHEQPKGSNTGPEINKYLAYVKLPPGKAWCAAFVSYCINQGATELNIDSTFKKSGSALHLVEYNPTLVIPQPTPNCIGIINHGKGLGHAFFISFLDETNSAHTIEGNTDHLDSREGWVVGARIRPIKDITYFLRID